MFDAAGLAVYLGMPTNSILAWQRARVGPAPVKIGSRLLYRRHVVDAWLAAGGDVGYGISLLRPRDPADELGVTLTVDAPFNRLLA